MSVKFSEDYFKSFTKEKFRDTINALSARFDMNLDVDKIVDQNKDATPAELRRLCENPELLVLNSEPEDEEATEALADYSCIAPSQKVVVVHRPLPETKAIHNRVASINKDVLIDTQDDRFIDILGDIKWCNSYHDMTDRLDKLTGNYFTATRAMVMDLQIAITGFFSDEVYNRKFLTFFNNNMRHWLSICARYDDNDIINPLKAIVIIKEVIDEHLNTRVVNDAVTDRVVHDVLFRQINPSFNFKTFKEYIYNYIDEYRGLYSDFYMYLLKKANSITTDKEFNQVYDEIHNITAAYPYIISTEATTKGASKVMKDVKDTGYKAYKTYKKHEENYDNQVTKLANFAKKMVFGDKREEIIEGKKWTVMGILKKVLGTVALFSFNPVVGLIGTVVLYATDKKMTYEERMKILKELENELAMINEKIEDAKAAGDNQAKYQLMRTANELSEAINKIRIAAKRGATAKATVRQALTGGGTGA